MPLKLFNTLGRLKEEFKPLKFPAAGIYACGPTVYNYQHIGNYRTYIFEDILKRTLGFLGFKPFHVMNITDVGHLTSQGDEGEDKVEVMARREGKSAWDLAKFYTDAFLKDCSSLNILPPDVLCRATDNIQEQIDLIRRLEKNGFLYSTSDGVYFETAKFPDYDKLMGKAHLSGIQFGARVEASPEKKSPSDFAVWKFSPKNQKRQMEWDSPWGTGFPGWHIECSAMAMKYLGETFDIHCGGVDHIPIHHSNEIAQSEGATGKPFVRYWLHGEFLLVNSSKMAKSDGTFITLEDLRQKGFDPLDYRYHCLTAHYRKQLDFTWEALESSKTARRKLRDLIGQIRGALKKPACADSLNAFKEALSDDLNMPEALSVLWSDLKNGALPEGARLHFAETAEGVLGLGLLEDKAEESLSPEIIELIDSRALARKNRDFRRSDEIRVKLFSLGIIVEDTPSGQKWRRA